jgi:20S proteasome alpha/beta subunit
MTLALNTLTPSGMILTADSRQTYRNIAGMVRIGSDSVTKLFKLTEKVGVAIAGRAFLPDPNGTPKNMGYFIEEFRSGGIDPAVTVKNIAQNLNDYLAGIFVTKERESLKAQIADAVTKQGGTDLVYKAPDGNLQPYSFRDSAGQPKEDAGFFETVDLIVAGIDDERVGRAYNVHVPKGIILENDTVKTGVMWIGQTDVVQRIILGYDSIGNNLSFVKEALARDPVQAGAELAKLQYLINWGTMSLQDAIDFNILITRTTESIQRFSDGTVFAPGGITGVGGNIAVAAVLPDRGFVWVTKRQLRAEESAIEID